MTKKELEKEIEDKGVEYADKQKRTISIHEDSGYSWGQIEQAYEKGALDFAEPREKRISELEKEMIQTLINDRYKMINKINTIICSNVSIEELTTTKLNVTCNNKGNFQPTDKSKSQGSLLYHPFQSFINKVKKLITK